MPADTALADAAPADAPPPDARPADAAAPDAARRDRPSADRGPLSDGPLAPFRPTSDTTLGPGRHVFSAVDIASGITVTLSGDVVLDVRGPVSIDGALRGNCTRIEIQAQGSVAITGTADNRCPQGAAAPADLVIHGHGGTLAIGSLTQPATLSTSGALDMASDPSIAEWEFDVLPHQRSSTLLPPVCAARSDTLLGTTTADAPLGVAFFGAGADPDGGPVSYRWDFGDGTSSTAKDPLHSYLARGNFTASLTVTDDDGQSCQSSVRLAVGDLDAPAAGTAALQGGPDLLVVEIGQAAPFDSSAHHPEGQALAYRWAFGDGATSSERHPVHSYAAAGRYAVSLTVTDPNDNVSQVASSLYVAPPAPLPLRRPQGNCINPVSNFFNVLSDGGTAGTGMSGRNATFRGRGDVVLLAGTNLKAQNGGNGQNRTGTGSVVGGRGGRGGNLQVLVDGELTVCGGATLSSGNGGAGGSATSTAGRPSFARGGSGGHAAELLRVASTRGLHFQSPFGASVAVNPGNGGAGGAASAQADRGTDQCNLATRGWQAEARGGQGGRASKVAIATGQVTGTATIEVGGGMGGDGGNGRASGGAGGAASGCQTTAQGGNGGQARASGGEGGEARFNLGTPGLTLNLAADAFTAGDGGEGYAESGVGGQASAIGLPGGPATATGGVGAAARADGGDGGAGRFPGDGGDGRAAAGNGGAAAATGGAGPACTAGGPGSATGGVGGESRAMAGRGGGATAADGTAVVVPASGGSAAAQGGAGGDCAQCPAGAGGPGGDATATGGNGGAASAAGAASGGDGGAATATGGVGGKGATCCAPPLPGGAGGKGGNATSTSGQRGGPGGERPANGGSGGNGGNGGDGDGPGAGGAGGLGSGSPNAIPNGLPGQPGQPCPKMCIKTVDSVSVNLGGYTISVSVKYEVAKNPPLPADPNELVTEMLQLDLQGSGPPIQLRAGGYLRIDQKGTQETRGDPSIELGGVRSLDPPRQVTSATITTGRVAKPYPHSGSVEYSKDDNRWTIAVSATFPLADWLAAVDPLATLDAWVDITWDTEGEWASAHIGLPADPDCLLLE